jgi:SGNH domain (fused to AT3 domains)
MGGALLLAGFCAPRTDAATLASASAREATANSGAPSSLAHSITLGTRLKTLPTNLTPPLGEVASDTPYSCIDSPAAASPQSVCMLGDVNATQTMVLFGDSHAWQWTPALNIVATQDSWKLVTYTKGGCPVENVGAKVPGLDEASTNCAQWRNVVFSQLSALHPALVIVSSQTKAFATAKDMTGTIRKLRADGAKVVWLEDTPYPGRNVPDCLAENESKIGKCGFTLTAGLYEPTVRAAVNHAAARAGASLINPAPWLCTGKICPPIIGDTVVYFDESHLSSTYAMTLAPELSAALSPSMATPGPP